MELVERERELDALAALLDGLAEGTPRMALIEGPAGIGKSRLLAETRRAGEERGIPSLGARASELEREFPFGIVRQLIEPALIARRDREELLQGPAESARTVFVPPDGGEPLGGDASFAILHGLYWLTVDLVGRNPLLLTIDDLHWCDRPSLRALAYVVHRLEGMPLLIVATLRSTEPGTDPALVAEIAHDPMTERIRPVPLSRAAMPGLVERRLGTAPEEAFATACHEATGGNPLLLDELLKGLAAEGIEPSAAQAGVVRDLGPRAVSRAVLMRLARLRDADLAVARAMAVLGEAAGLAEIAALTGLDTAAVADSTRELERVEILRPEPRGFVHPLVRDAVYNDLSPAERELDHRRAAGLLHEAGAPPERVAAHVLRVPPIGEEWVADLLVEAARGAAERGGTDNAVACLRRALEEPLAAERRTAVLYELGQREMDVRGDEAVPHLREAYEQLADPEQRAWAGYSLARTLMFTRQEIEAARVARQAREELPDGFDDLARALEALELETVYFGRPEIEDLERTAAYREGLPDSGPGSLMLKSVTAYTWCNGGGPADQCAALAREALAGDVLFELDNGLFWVTALVVLIYADLDDTGDIWEEVRAVAHRRGSLFTMLTVDLWRGFDLLRRGDLEQAQESIEDALEEMLLWSGSEAGMVIEWPIGFLAEIQVERGGLDEAERLLARADPGERFGDGPNFWRKSKIELLLARGQFEEAAEFCDRYEANLGTMRNPAPAPWRTLKAQALDRTGRSEEAIELARAELELARAWGGGQAIGHALRVLGQLRREQGLGELREAVATLEPSTARLEHAKALLGLGTGLRLARQPTEAREPLRRALEIASACSADGLVERIRAELGAAGARPRREALGGVAALTPSERRVADMAADELTNREIAQALFVTPKTVEVHLSNAYRKLEIRSRRELAGALA
jgi:DNA-binding CsgD family transcriptional regulator